MRVIKRNGRIENVYFNKIFDRINLLCFGLNKKYIDVHNIAKLVIGGLYDLISTKELDSLAIKVCAGLVVEHPDYSLLAGRISISNLQKNAPKTFSECVNKLYNQKRHGKNFPLVSKEFYKYVMDNKDVLNAMVINENDFNYDIFAIETLKKSYLMKCNDEIVETPQYLHLRVATFLNMENGIKDIKESYTAFTEKKYIHASPTLFNAGANITQLASCFLIKLKEDSVEGVYSTLKDCANIAKTSGGIGVSLHELRSKGSYISSSGGKADGIVPVLKLFEANVHYINQGNKRKGSIAAYLSMYHSDIEQFLKLRLPGGDESQRTRNLFTGLWISDLFFERVKNNELWSLFDPNIAKGLNLVYGDEFNKLYEKYEKGGKFVKRIRAQELWNLIVTSITETGTPYLLNKDQCNRLSNQNNLGTIESSNLCSEIIQYSNRDEVGVCNLASLNLSSFVNVDNKTIDYDEIAKISGLACKNLNIVIDKSFNPTIECENSNKRNRPIGIGVSGLADCFFKLGIAFDSNEAKLVNKKIFEAIYFGAMEKSIELAKKYGPYSSFNNSYFDKGLLQFDLWRSKDINPILKEELINELTIGLNKWDNKWEKLRSDLKKYGIRNSLLTCCMPTASSSNIQCVTECIEPLTSNIFSRNVLSGEFIIINKFLVDRLDELNLWDKKMSQKIIEQKGSIQNISNIPEEIKSLFKTAWEISNKDLIDMSFHRSQFIDQSQSLNLFMRNVTPKRYSSMIFYGYNRGLKTLQYYLRSQNSTSSTQFTLEVENEECLSCQS